MKKQRTILSYLLAFFLFSLFLVGTTNSQPAQSSPDVVIRIARVDKIMQTLDRLADALPNASQPTPSNFLKTILNGTDWIDPDRAVVIGAFIRKDTSEPLDAAAALIPFTRPNDEFLMNYKAVAGSDYYLIGLPPGQGGIVSDRMEESLVAASLTPPDGLVSLDLAASQIIAKADEQIQRMLQTIEQKMPTDAVDTDYTPKQIRQMLTNLINTGRELESLSLGLDATDQELAFLCNAKALKASGLADIFDVEAEQTPRILADYQPAYQMNFHAKPYDINSVVDFLDKNFGLIYDQMGIDFGQVKDITKFFTGEMAGGVSFSANGLDLEVIAVFDETKQLPKNYLESVYLPWVLDYGKTMAEYMNPNVPDNQVENLFEKMSPSTVAGQSVVGIKGKMPMGIAAGQRPIELTLRMTRLNSMLLTASDDQRLQQLINTAKNLDKSVTNASLMRMDIDLTAYLNGLNEFLPAPKKIKKEQIPEFGSFTYTMDMADGILKTRYAMALDDIQKMAGLFNSLDNSLDVGQQPSLAQLTGAGQSRRIYSKNTFGSHHPKTAQTSKARVEPDKDNPQYWLNHGELFATYGNDKRAIEHFKKAIELDPNNSKAYFHLGVIYGETGEFDKALEAINRALMLKPKDGDYFYARGWIFLLSGKKEKATPDMQRAAELGNPDAKNYLESIEPRYPN